MCGIAGIISKQPINPKWIVGMTNRIKHRGPDDEGYLFAGNNEVSWAYGDDTPEEVIKSDYPYSPKIHVNNVNFEDNYKIAFGHRRLSIIDLSPAGHQPMSYADGKLWIIFNGEIYNYIELREELEKKGYLFKTKTDTEVILASYAEWGENCLNKFNGMWAFVILDLNKNIIFGARDRFGVKPLYYFKDDKYFSFASEIKALATLPFYNRGINGRAVFDYFVTGIEEYDNESFFKDIHELKPSHCFIFNLNNGNFKIFKYYELYFFDDFEAYDSKKVLNYSIETRKLIFNSIKIRLRSDVPVGTCLSGGLDSSTVACVIKGILRETSLNQIGDRQKVFTASYPGKKIDESNWAKVVVDSTNSEWFLTFPKPDELIEDLEELVYFQDIPFGSTSIYAQYRVMRLAKENNVKVLLDGQGGDELFCGYNVYYKVYLAELLMQRQFQIFLREFKEIKNNGVNPLKGILKNIIAPILPLSIKKLFMWIKFPLLDYLDNSFLNSNINRVFIEETSNKLNEFLHKHITYLNLKSLLRYEDRNSMRFSIEARTPFADDVELIEYVFKIPSSYKIHDGWTKYLLRISMDGIIPPQIQWRRDKIGFATPEKEWLIKNKEFFREALRGRLDGFLDENKILGDWDKIIHEQPEDTITPLWKIINFGLWRKVFNV